MARGEESGHREARRHRRRESEVRGLETAEERERRRARTRRRKERDRERDGTKDEQYMTSAPATSNKSSKSSAQALSADALGKLNRLNAQGHSTKSRTREVREGSAARHPRPNSYYDDEQAPENYRRQRHVPRSTYAANEGSWIGRRRQRRKRRVVSGALLEDGDGIRVRPLRGGYMESEYDEKQSETIAAGMSKRRKICIAIGVFVVILVVVVVIAVVVSKKNSGSSSSNSVKSNGVSQSDVPTAARNMQMDPSIWLDTRDFNTTYTNVTVGGLPIIGLNSTWDDSTRANSAVPALNSSWTSYTAIPARGVNLGGWLSIEPFITPSLFSSYDTKLGIIDEYTLTKHLGASTALSTLEKHYSTFITEQDFADIAAAGLDHVRIPFSYWAWQVFDEDPYVFRTSWRYLLRGIEWARKHGLRINLDVHGLPGSQNGWNHSGRQGDIGWLNGTNGALNAQRSLDMHNALSQFFAQPRYANIIAFYGLANEPKMTALNATAVNAWSASAYTLARSNGINAYIVIGDGFRGLENWQGDLEGYTNMVLDVHQYVIFNVAQIVYNHTQKVNYACSGWTQQAELSMNVATGFGLTMFAEWSQADTDCATYLNNIGWGNRWTGTYTTGNSLTQVLSPTCPASPTSGCECTDANADPSQYSAEYKAFLLMFAEAQMTSFDKGLGWFYWTWVTEDAPQWSYKAGLAAGILPANARNRTFTCTQTVPDFKVQGLSETY